MKILAMALGLVLSINLFAQETELSAEDIAAYQHIQDVIDSLTPIHGEVDLGNGLATLSVPDNFYYLAPADSQKVLVDLWGNPPSEPGLGMILPSEYSPLEAAGWAVTIDYREEGYVSDEDAAGIDYDEMLKQMKKDTRTSSAARKKAGYEGIELIGWAATPYYDAEEKKLHWAKELAFEGMDTHTLNYNIRVLGRQGVLELNFVAGMAQLDEINANLEPVLAMTSFNDGNRYSDFNPDVDKVAAYGIGALVAGKVLAKTGFFALLLVFLKKFWVFAAVGIWGAIKLLFGQKKKTESPTQ